LTKTYNYVCMRSYYRLFLSFDTSLYTCTFRTRASRNVLRFIMDVGALFLPSYINDLTFA